MTRKSERYTVLNRDFGSKFTFTAVNVLQVLVRKKEIYTTGVILYEKGNWVEKKKKKVLCFGKKMEVVENRVDR